MEKERGSRGELDEEGVKERERERSSSLPFTLFLLASPDVDDGVVVAAVDVVDSDADDAVDDDDDDDEAESKDDASVVSTSVLLCNIFDVSAVVSVTSLSSSVNLKSAGESISTLLFPLLSISFSCCNIISLIRCALLPSSTMRLTLRLSMLMETFMGVVVEVDEDDDEEEEVNAASFVSITSSSSSSSDSCSSL